MFFTKGNVFKLRTKRQSHWNRPEKYSPRLMYLVLIVLESARWVRKSDDNIFRG